MEISALQILILVLCVIAVAACFVRRISAALIAYGALICANASGTAIHTEDLIFWGIATALVLGVRFLLGTEPGERRIALAYTAGGAACGAFVGMVIRPTSAGAIIGSAVGVFLAALAYMKTPRGPHYAVTSKSFVDFLAAKGLPAVVAMSMVAITTASILAATMQ